MAARTLIILEDNSRPAVDSKTVVYIAMHDMYVS